MKQGTIALVLSPHPFHSIPISCSVIPPALLASLRESRIGVCLSANLFLGNKVIFLAAIAFYGSPPNDATGQAGREASGPATSTASVRPSPQPRGGVALVPQCPFSSSLHCSRAKFVPHATDQPASQPGAGARTPK